MYLKLLSAVFVVALTVFVMQKLRGTKYEFKISVALTVAFFLTIVFFTCIWGSREGLGGFSFKFPTPFLSAIINLHYGVIANRSMLNLLLFMPFGYLLSTDFSLKNNGSVKWLTVVLIGLAVSLTIETCQLIFRFGVFEVDDILKNTLGAGLGYYIFYRLNKRNSENSRSQV
jgi:glycopeptide antibiotics resistance protein